MIIKPKVRGNGAKLADYLLKSGKNDKAELIEMRGFHVPTVKGAFGLVEVIAEGTQCEKPFYHVSFRLAPGEILSLGQWQESANRLEQRLGLENQGRAIVMHTHSGEQHMHVVWSRLDEENLKAINMFQDWPRCQQIARELEREFGLKQVRDLNDERKLAPPTFNEDQQARRKGQALAEKRATIWNAWERSDDGQSFVAALNEAGFILARGDRRDFVAVDKLGSVYTIGKRTTGVSAAQVRAKLHGLDSERLPTVEAAKAVQCERMQEGKIERSQQTESNRDFSEHQEIADRGHKAPPRVPGGAAFIHHSNELTESAGRGVKGTKIAGGLAGGVLKAVSGILDFLIPSAPKTPEQQQAQKQQRREKQAEAEMVEWERLRAERLAMMENTELNTTGNLDQSKRKDYGRERERE